MASSGCASGHCETGRKKRDDIGCVAGAWRRPGKTGVLQLDLGWLDLHARRPIWLFIDRDDPCGSSGSVSNIGANGRRAHTCFETQRPPTHVPSKKFRALSRFSLARILVCGGDRHVLRLDGVVKTALTFPYPALRRHDGVTRAAGGMEGYGQ